MNREQAVRNALRWTLCNAGNYPQSFAHMVLGEDLSKLIDNAHEAVMKVVVDSDEFEYNMERDIRDERRLIWDTWASEALTREVYEGSKETFKHWNLKIVRRRKAGKVEEVD